MDDEVLGIGDRALEIDLNIGGARSAPLDHFALIGLEGCAIYQEVYLQVCCYVRLCNGSYAIQCTYGGHTGILGVVTDLRSRTFTRVVKPQDMNIDVGILRNLLTFTEVTVPSGHYITIDRDYILYTSFRFNPSSIASALVFSYLGIPWYTDLILSTLVEYVPIAIEISRSGTRFSEVLELYNNGHPDVIARITVNPWTTIEGVDDVYIVRVLYVDFVRR